MNQPLVVSATEMGIPTIPNYIIVSATQILPGGPPPGVVPGARQHPARQHGAGRSSRSSVMHPSFRA
jgi:hypothetical protein